MLTMLLRKLGRMPMRASPTGPPEACADVSLPGCGPRDLFVTAAFILVALGTVMVFSASSFHWSVPDDSYHFLRRQLLWLPIAFGACFLFSHLGTRVLRRFYCQFLVASLVLLAIVLVPHVGRNVNASTRWLPLGGGLQFQPSELAKLSVVLFVAGFMAKDPERRRSFCRGFLPVSAAILPVFLLILVEPDFGTAMFVLALGSLLLYLAGMRLWYFLASASIFAPLIAGFVYHRWDQVKVRLLGVLDPTSLYQVKQSLTALGIGGWDGVGLGGSVQKLRFLPEPHTDFILAIIGEELGFIGCVAVIALFAVCLWSGLAMVWRFRDPFSFLAGAGILLSLTSQAVFNVAVVTGSAPTKGIPLPFVTFGGSGLLVAMAQVGILLALERENRTALAAESPA